MRFALCHLVRVDHSERWPKEQRNAGEDLRYFDPRPDRHDRFGDWTVRYLSFWDEPGPDAVPVVEGKIDFADALLDALERPEWSSIRDQQCEIARAESVSEIRRRKEDAGEYWYGSFETSFVLGRLAHLLGPAPEREAPVVSLAVQAHGPMVDVGASDHHGWGLPALYGSAYETGADVDGALAATVELPLDEPVVGDAMCIGLEDTSMRSYVLGVHEGQLFNDGIGGIWIPPWFAVAR